MLDFWVANGGTIAVGAVVAAVVILVVVNMIKNRGKSSCGGGCETCPSGGICHKK